jgi:hypothetical protein
MSDSLETDKLDILSKNENDLLYSGKFISVITHANKKSGQ